MISICLAIEADLPAIVETYNEDPWQNGHRRHNAGMVEERLEWFRKHDPSTHPIFDYQDSGQIIGWTSLSASYGRPAYKKTVEVSTYVTTQRQRSGVGTALREHVLSVCPRSGIKAILSFAFGHNLASIHLNAKFGFTKWGHLPYVAELDGIERDLVIMRKPLERQEPNKNTGANPGSDEYSSECEALLAVSVVAAFWR